MDTDATLIRASGCGWLADEELGQQQFRAGGPVPARYRYQKWPVYCILLELGSAILASLCELSGIKRACKAAEGSVMARCDFPLPRLIISSHPAHTYGTVGTYQVPIR